MTTHKYRVRPGFTYGVNSQYKEGDIVELEESTAVHVMDKVELAEVIQNTAPPVEPPADLESPTESLAHIEPTVPEIPKSSAAIRSKRTIGN